MTKGPSRKDDPFLPVRFELISTSICALTLVEMIVRYGYHPALLPWHHMLADSLEMLAVSALLLRLPVRIWTRRFGFGLIPGSLFDLFLSGVALIALFRGHLTTAALFAVFRLGIVAFRILPQSQTFQRIFMHIQVRPTRVLAISFLLTILAGTFLLTLPAATADGRGAAILDALFTATSAVCVTGLIVVDTGSYFSRFGQVVILGLIQIGAIGIMTLSASVALLFRRRLGLRTRAVMQNLMEETSAQGLAGIVRYIVGMTFAIEAIGFVVLFFRWGDIFPDTGERLYYALFHSISAFCNAGFSLFANSLAGRPGEDPIVLLTIGGLIILGGIGFTVISGFLNRDLLKKGVRRTFGRLNSQSRLILFLTFLLLALGTLFIFFFEFDQSLDTMPAGEKLLTAFFQSVTARTAGFNRVDMSHMVPATILLTIILMFIGAAPGSTGGGIKITTLGVLVLSVKAMLQGREDVEIYRRTIPKSTVYRTIAITVISALVVTVFFLLLLATQAVPFQSMLFETISAFANVGLSLGVTPNLNFVGRLLVILLMYIGRIGPLTLTLAIGEKLHSADYRYPAARIQIG